MSKSKRGTIWCMVIFVIALFICGCSLWPEKESYSTTNIDEYRNFENHIEGEKDGIFSGLKIFPVKITNQMQDVSYMYECGNIAFNNGYLIYLECSWTEESFENEIIRLQEIFVSNKDETKRVIYDEELFAYPAYIAVYDESEDRKEYALVDKDKRKTIYLYCQFQNHLLESKIESQYYAKRTENMENKLLQGGYNMYKFEIENGIFEYIK